MDRAELVRSVKAIIEREAAIDVSTLNDDSRLGDFEIDSLDIMKLAYVFEKTFDITVAPSELGLLRTFGDMIDALEQKLAAGAARENLFS